MSPEPAGVLTAYEEEVLIAVRVSLVGDSTLVDRGIEVSDVHLSGSAPDTTVVVVWADSSDRRGGALTASWGLYDGSYPGGVPGTAILTPPGTIASVIFSNVLD